jgi:hypothetical protein
MQKMLIVATLIIAAAAAQPAVNAPSPQCHQYDGAVFYGRIRELRLRRTTPRAWSAEDHLCDRFFFPAKLSPTLDAKAAHRITAAVNARRGDDYVQLDAQVSIKMDADHSGGVLTVMALQPRR